MSCIRRVVCVLRELELSARHNFKLVALLAAGERAGTGSVSRDGLGGRGAVEGLSGAHMRVWQMVNL